MSAAEVVVRMSTPNARTITDRIKAGVEAIWELITQAYVERAWDALGYSSWDDYCTREFGTSRLRLPREERSEVVSSLRESGLSIRAIASATGHSVNTVQKDLYQIDTPAATECAGKCATDECICPADDLAEELIQAEPPGGLTEDSPGQTDRVREALEHAKPATVIGIDGKRYQPQQRPVSESPTQRRKPLPEAFTESVIQLGKVTNQIEAHTRDDRFAKNTDQIALRVSDLVRARDALQRVISKFND